MSLQVEHALADGQTDIADGNGYADNLVETLVRAYHAHNDNAACLCVLWMGDGSRLFVAWALPLLWCVVATAVGCVAVMLCCGSVLAAVQQGGVDTTTPLSSHKTQQPQRI